MMKPRKEAMLHAALVALLALPWVTRGEGDRHVEVGDDRATVQQILGKPVAEVGMGNWLKMVYATGEVKLVDGKVVGSTFTDVDGEIKARRKVQRRPSGQGQTNRDKPALEKDETKSAEADKKFMTWALENTAVTDIAINYPTMFVTLTQDKYTTKENVQQIADSLAKAYCMQTGKQASVCRIYLGRSLYAKGQFSR